MVRLTVKVSGGIEVPSVSRLGQAINMAKLAQFSLQTVKNRITSGIGSDDAPMPPLKHGKGVQFDSRANGRARFRAKPGYAAWKVKVGALPIRNMSATGAMLANLTVRSATATRFVIALTKRKERIKALANERRTPFLSFSGSDERIILDYARKLFNAGVEVLRRGNSGQRYGKRIGPGSTLLP